MKARSVVPALWVVALLAQAAGAASVFAAEPAAAEPKTAAQTPAKPESALKQGMSVEEVRQVMGKPAGVNPMAAPTGKAEIWVYRRQVGERVDRVQVGTIPVVETFAGPDGMSHQRTIGETVQYADVHLTIEETVELLMFNDHYVTLKVSRHEVKRYL